MKLLLWAQDYCPFPKWQPQNTVRVIRVIAKPTTWKTSTVLVPSTQTITVWKLWRKCSIKVQPLWKEYEYKPQFRCPDTLFFPVLLACYFLFLLTHCLNDTLPLSSNINNQPVSNMCTCIFISPFEESFSRMCSHPHLKDMAIYCTLFMHKYSMWRCGVGIISLARCTQ